MTWTGPTGRLAAALVVAALIAPASSAGALGSGGEGPGLSFDAAGTRATRLVGRMTLDEKLDIVSGNGSYLGGVAGTASNARLGIPGLAFTDGPNGVGNGQTGVTAFPAALTLAAAWNARLARRYGSALGQESRRKGRNFLAAPTLNVVRSPKWGRVPETFGEDPYLTGRIGAEEVRGIQGQGVIAQIKHYAVNDQEEGRFGEPVGQQPAVDSVLSERALW